MDRIETIREYLSPYIVSRIHKKIEEAGRMRGDCLISFAAAAIHDALQREEQQPQWKPSYMGLFHLMTSLITGSHEYELIIADKRMHLDESQVVSYWRPEFLYQDKQEEEYIRKELGKHFVRLSSYEITYAKRFVFYEYRNIMGVYWKEHLAGIMKLEGFVEMRKDTPFRFLFGDYMGETHAVLDYGEV